MLPYCIGREICLGKEIPIFVISVAMGFVIAELVIVVESRVRRLSVSLESVS